MSKVKVLAGLAPTGGSKEFIPCLSPSSWWHPASLAFLGSEKHHSNLCFRLHLASSCVSLGLKSPPPYSYMGTSHWI